MNKLKQSFLSGLVFSGTIILSFFAYGAWTNLSNVTTTDTLTSTRWNELIDKVNLIGGTYMPAGAVIAFNLASCPTGWVEYTPARGRFVRGIDSTGTNDTIRVAGNLQDDEIISHDHEQYGATMYNYSPKYYSLATGVGADIEVGGRLHAKTNLTGGTETRPKNVALLYCVKQ